MKPNQIISILLALFVLILLYRVECGKPVDPTTIETIKTVIDTQDIHHTVYVKKPGKTIRLDTVIYVKVPYLDSVQIDSIEENYYAKNVYTDTIAVDSIGYVYIQDTIQMNNIATRIFKADIKSRTVKETVTITKSSKNQVYFGPRADLSNTYRAVGMGLILKTKRDKIYGIGASIGSSGIIYSGQFLIKL
jgi:uncharacterized 2Fe-2S/4Fe-4S cluster protein (DUF4445 family)